MRKHVILLCACAMAIGAQAGNTVYPVAKRVAPKTSTKAVAAPTDVHFALPEGCFWFGDIGARSSYYYYMCSSIVAPAHTPITIKNDGSAEGEYTWAYCDPTHYSYSMKDFSMLSADTRDLTFESDCYNFVQVPTLTRTLNGTSTDWTMPTNYYLSLIQFGGVPGDFIYGNVPGEEEKGHFGFTQWNFNSAYVNLFASSDLKSYVFGKGGQTTEAGITGLAAMFHQPAAPYVIRGGLKAFMTISCDDDAELTVTLRRATKVSDEEYDLGAELGHCTLSGTELKKMIREPIGDDYLGFFTFKDFTLTNEEGNEVSVMPLTINTPIAVVFSGWQSSKFEKFEIFTNEQVLDSNKQYDAIGNSRIETSTFWTGGPYGNKAKARFKNFVGVVTLDAFFPILHVDAEGYDAPAEGGTQSFKVDRYQYAAEESFAATCEADWVTCKASYEKGVRNYGGVLEITVEPNEGEARSAVVVLTDTDGSRTEFVVTQAASAGVYGVASDAASAALEGGSLVVRGYAGMVEVYGASGMLVKSLNVDGETAVSVAELPSGVYFVRFDNGNVSRFIK